VDASLDFPVCYPCGMGLDADDMEFLADAKALGAKIDEWADRFIASGKTLSPENKHEFDQLLRGVAEIKARLAEIRSRAEE
jgi:hypothetical protein